MKSEQLQVGIEIEKTYTVHYYCNRDSVIASANYIAVF